jgi:hypothetical protein
MTPERDTPPQGQIDPLLAGVRDGVRTGYRALEHVREGLRESLRVRAEASVPAQPARGRTAARPEPRLDVVDDLARIAAELLQRGSELAQDVARSIVEQPLVPPRPGPAGRLAATVHAGKEAKVEFRLTNTGASPLREVTPVATDLVAGRQRVSFEAVSFEPPVIEYVRPGGSVLVTVTVDTSDFAPDVYRCLVHAEPASAVLEITVAAP